ncbi:NAD-dependent deacetylase [Rhodothermaceae bacterium RA]|nr:NAD-dependent deacetylase [Rhodothermaceae bacterium RA]
MANAAPWPGFHDLVALLRGRRTVVLSGAGCSTESGIPDYRGPETRRRARNPIQHRAFVTDPAARVRYWMRSAVGWPRFTRAEPNPGHLALARLEAAGLVRGIITQNVDRLHQAAGSRRVVELHGALAEVRCLACGTLESRSALQHRIERLNPGWSARSGELAPDGDAELPEALTQGFAVPTCRTCNGPLKPNVVFFGEHVPPDRVEAAWRLFDEADVLLVVGSSLAVYSGYRFVLRAVKEQKPFALVNLGPARGSDRAAVHVDGQTGAVLPRLADALLGEALRRSA